MTQPGTLIGLGLGPGDPDLITVKAMKALQAAPVIAYFCKRGRRGHARTIADPWIGADVIEMPLVYPVTTELPFDHPDYVGQLSRFYEASADALAVHLEAGRDVALLCEGDPLFYGSYMHLHVRLKDRVPVTIIPGVTGMSGCWTAAQQPMTWGDDVLTVLPATLPQSELTRRLAETDAAVVMKLGSNFPKVRAALEAAGMTDRALYVERGTMMDEKVVKLSQKVDDLAPYFALVLVPGQGRRP